MCYTPWRILAKNPMNIVGTILREDGTSDSEKTSCTLCFVHTFQSHEQLQKQFRVSLKESTKLERVVLTAPLLGN